MDKSLLQQAEQEEEEARLVLLETVREFGLESLNGSEEAERCHRTHAEYYLALAEHAEPHLRGGGEQLRWLSLLNQEQENFRAALHCFAGHEETELALRLSGALWWYWFMRGYNNEALHWLETALALPNRSGRTAARANVLAAARAHDVCSSDGHCDSSDAPEGEHDTLSGTEEHTWICACRAVSRIRASVSGRLCHGSSPHRTGPRSLSRHGRHLACRLRIERFGTAHVGAGG